MLRAHELVKDFGPVRVLEGVSLELRPGEVHALLGENGAGKSTLIKIMTGAYRRDAGSVRFAGAEVDFASPKAAQAARMRSVRSCKAPGCGRSAKSRSGAYTRPSCRPGKS